MIVNDAERGIILAGLLEIVRGKARLVADVTEVDNEEADDYEGSVDDFLNTAQVVFEARNNFAQHGDLMLLKQEVRSGLDTMVWEEVYDVMGWGA